MRLLHRRQFQWLARGGLRGNKRFLALHYSFPPHRQGLSPRLGISVSTKFGNSVRRNRFKRVVREGFRHCIRQLPLGVDISVRPGKQGDSATVEGVIAEFVSLLATQAILPPKKG